MPSAHSQTRRRLSAPGMIGAGIVLIVVFAAGWFWCALGYLEEWSEESKAQSAGTTMAGWGFAWGLMPVIVVHAAVAVVVFLALRVGGRRGVMHSIGLTVMLVVALSLPGFLTMQALSPGGTMFAPPPSVP